MKQKLKKILLVDDSQSDNFYHKRIIDKCNVTENVVIKYSGEEALEYLTTIYEEQYPNPDLLFLDINMPGMTGWEFLDEYNNLPTEQKAHIVVTMLTTSQNDDDRSKAEQNKLINRFQNKPLDQDVLMDIIRENFPERF